MNVLSTTTTWMPWGFQWRAYLEICSSPPVQQKAKTFIVFQISVFNRIGSCGRNKRRLRINDANLNSSPEVGEVNTTGIAMEEIVDVELGEVDGQTSADTLGEKTPPTSVSKEEVNQETWKEIARALDRVFYWLFLALVVSSSITIYAHAGKL